MRVALICTLWAWDHLAMSEQHSPTPAGKLRERAAEELRAVLARRRMSGAELARRTGMKQPYLSRRMTGEVPFDLDDLEIIARELEVSVTQLLADAETGSDTTWRENLPPSSQGAMIPFQRANHPIGRREPAGTGPNLRRPGRVESVAAA